MSEKNYPTRMHEVLGVETGERFEIPNYAGEVYIDNYGYLFSVSENDFVPGPRVCEAINQPERITRRPRLTEEQVEKARALVTLGFRWLTKDQGTEDVRAHAMKPSKKDYYWDYVSENAIDGGAKIPVGCFRSLVSWDDPEPLDIVQTLRDAGVEVE